MVKLSKEEKRLLLDIAHSAISRAFRGDFTPPDLESLPLNLRRKGASFVTLKKNGKLRGCIGSVVAHRPLAEDVHFNAIAAAFKDPRFPPLHPDEWPHVKVEVSVLSDPKPLPYDDMEDLLRKIKPGMGLILRHPLGTATFLPEVWENLPDPYIFLSELARKANLPPDVYNDPRTEVFYYTTESFTYDDL
ncbi:MAG: AmmeMemoRadiSam system protein A [Thermotogae bacterium]|nr:AmmeMemoRadiSam system protein A [Thermotogota bacterium]